MDKALKHTKRFLKFFIISLLSWFIIVPQFELHDVILAIMVGVVSGTTLSLSMDIPFYRHIFNFFKYFTKVGFYRYLLFMVKEVIISTYDVLKSALNFSHPYKSMVVRITLPKSATVDKALLVTLSIIMTPGTTIIDIKGKELAVHCLTKNAHNAMVEMLFVYKILSFDF